MLRITSDFNEFENNSITPTDFTDIGVRRLDGAVADAASRLQQVMTKLKELQQTNPQISIYELARNEELRYHFAQIPNFKEYLSDL